jgi:hypothetical protein
VRDPEGLFSRTLDSVQGNARLAEASLAEEGTAALDATDKDVSIGGAGLAAAAIELEHERWLTSGAAHPKRVMSASSANAMVRSVVR